MNSGGGKEGEGGTGTRVGTVAELMDYHSLPFSNRLGSFPVKISWGTPMD